MEWIIPVKNRKSTSRTTAADMNRITNNIMFLGGSPVKATYSITDIVTAEEWEYIVDFAGRINPEVTDATNYINLNNIEAGLEMLYQHSRLKPSNTLLPSENLVPNKEV